MPIIKPGQIKKPGKVKILMDAKLIEEIEKYCSWAKVDNKDIFFSQAVEFLLEKDKEWKKYKKGKSA